MDEDYIAEAEAKLIHTYNRFPVVFDHGEGVTLYDTEGKAYLDFAAGIAVMALGYDYKPYADALKAQIDKLIHTSNLYYHVPLAAAAENTASASGMDRVFFTNSGTEAIEGAIKLARKYRYLKNPSSGNEIIAMKHSFHGRSMGSLAVTGQPKYQEAFRPLIGGVRFADFNSLESVEAQITPDTCAVLLEPVQGEGGIYPADQEFLEGVRKLCTEHDIALIFDEIQCGMGRTGSMYAWMHYGVKPDILTTAKALGCGIPVGAFAATEQFASAFVPGDHGTTYGGNPLAMAAVNAVFQAYRDLDLVAHVNEVAPYLRERLNKFCAEHDNIVECRGLGLMLGLEFNEPVGPVIRRALSRGLVLISAGSNIIRFVPPLVITRFDVDRMIDILSACV